MCDGRSRSRQRIAIVTLSIGFWFAVGANASNVGQSVSNGPGTVVIGSSHYVTLASGPLDPQLHKTLPTAGLSGPSSSTTRAAPGDDRGGDRPDGGRPVVVPPNHGSVPTWLPSSTQPNPGEPTTSTSETSVCTPTPVLPHNEPHRSTDQCRPPG
jgi:hypothetical protein